MHLDPIAAFAIMCGVVAMIVGHVFNQARIERDRRLAAHRQSNVRKLHSSGNARRTSVLSR